MTNTETTKTNELDTTTTAQQRLLLKLVAASVMVKAVQKDGENTFQSYSFQSEAAIKNAVKPALEANGIEIIPSYQLLDQRDVTGKRGTNHIVDVLGTYVITDGVATLTGTMLGSGSDTMEKAMAKACTSAQKYFLKQLFNISDKDTDPDGDDSTRGQQQSAREPSGVPAELIETLRTTIADAARERRLDSKEVAKVVFEAANVKPKKWSQLSRAEVNSLDRALSDYMKG